MTSGSLEEKQVDMSANKALQNLFYVLPDITSIPSLKPGSYLCCNRKKSVTEAAQEFISRYILQLVYIL